MEKTPQTSAAVSLTDAGKMHSTPRLNAGGIIAISGIQ
jgi:hypothetical protein